jgi:hypothetical protein
MTNEHMDQTMQFDLVPDSKGVVWDLLLYIPTVIALATISGSLWYDGDQNTSYLFLFLTCFFFIAGFNRVFTRLMLFPSSPVRLVVGEQSLGLVQKGGTQVNLVKSLRYFADYAGKSFAVSGLDGAGKQLQFVFHRGQFAAVEKFDSAQAIFKTRFKKQ